MTRLLLPALLLGFVAATRGDEGPKPAPNRATEPMAKAVSVAKGVAFLDAVSADWTANRKCATCHTNVAYLIARPSLGVKTNADEAGVRAFFETRAANWGRGRRGDAPKTITEVVVTAASLAIHDAGTTGKLHPTTRAALARMWTVQQKDGAWDWEKCEWPPVEHDDYFGAALAALGVGMAPGGYAKSPEAKAGLVKLRAYLAKTPPPTLHHRAWLLWASRKLDGLLTAAEQKEAVDALLAIQKPDGGWSLPSLGDWKGFDGRANDAEAASDGYGTGLVVHVLLQAGVKKDAPAIAKGVAWLKANQRESGRWFTRSLNTDRAHYITHAGTAFALLAIKGAE
jgi:squalene-hopene/tetraprenyl-beta-curcumene cyclase